MWCKPAWERARESERERERERDRERERERAIFIRTLRRIERNWEGWRERARARERASEREIFIRIVVRTVRGIERRSQEILKSHRKGITRVLLRVSALVAASTRSGNFRQCPRHGYLKLSQYQKQTRTKAFCYIFEIVILFCTYLRSLKYQKQMWPRHVTKMYIMYSLLSKFYNDY